MSDAFHILIGVRELTRHLDDPGWCVVDCRHELTDPEFGRAAYAAGHIPGAIFMHLDEDLAGSMTGTNGRHPLPDPEGLVERLGRLGISNDAQVVAYDDAGGMFAARLWVLLRWLGHHKVAVLDGGFGAWRDDSQPLETLVPARRPVRYKPTLQPLMVDLDHVMAHLHHPDMCIIDARSPDRFRGENETLDPVGGHIPGAINRFFRDNLESGHFKSSQQLRSEFLSLLREHVPSQVVHQCGSGVTACHNLLAMEHAGFSGTRLYAGSWSEWCADPARPIATGQDG
ncbi:sulfurtransferase [Rhodocyclaceae bacterium SMB388]